MMRLGKYSAGPRQLHLAAPQGWRWGCIRLVLASGLLCLVSVLQISEHLATSLILSQHSRESIRLGGGSSPEMSAHGDLLMGLHQGTERHRRSLQELMSTPLGASHPRVHQARASTSHPPAFDQKRAGISLPSFTAKPEVRKDQVLGRLSSGHVSWLPVWSGAGTTPDRLAVATDGGGLTYPALFDVIAPSAFAPDPGLRSDSHPEPSQRVRGTLRGGQPASASGDGKKRKKLCIAIPSVARSPTTNGNSTTDFSVEDVGASLLHDLADKQAEDFYRNLEIEVVVYAAQCPQREPARNQYAWNNRRLDNGMSLSQQRGQRTGLGGMSTHERKLRQAVSTALKISVLGPRPEICQLFASMEDSLGLSVTKSKNGSALLWRTKVAVDFVYTLHQCLATEPDYILFLEDDVIPAKAYDYEIQQCLELDLKSRDWAAMSLYLPTSYGWRLEHMDPYKFECCKQAVLFNADVLPQLTDYVERHFTTAPSDWLLSQALDATRNKGFIHVPSVFQHAGKISSKQTRRQEEYHTDPLFQDELFEALREDTEKAITWAVT